MTSIYHTMTSLDSFLNIPSTASRSDPTCLKYMKSKTVIFVVIITNADNADYSVEYQYVNHRSDRRYRMMSSSDSQSLPVTVHCCDHVSLSVYIKPLCLDLLDCYVTTINSPRKAGTCFTVQTPTIIVNNRPSVL